MKQFAFQISVKCGNENLKDCISIFSSLGYSVMYTHGSHSAIISYCGKEHCGIRSLVGIHDAGFDDRYYIDHFNPELIRDIAAACTNDTWQEGEMALVYYGVYNTFEYEKVLDLLNDKICETKSKRPTLAEICAHHGYEIKGRDIVKKVEKDHSTLCGFFETCSAFNRLITENADLREKLEALTDVDNQELDRLREENAELKRKYEPLIMLFELRDRLFK